MSKEEKTMVTFGVLALVGGPFQTQELAQAAGDQYILTNLTPQG